MIRVNCKLSELSETNTDYYPISQILHKNG